MGERHWQSSGGSGSAAAPRAAGGVSQLCAAATRTGRRASLSIHWPDRMAKLIHYAIGDSAPTLRVGQQLARAPQGRGTIVFSTVTGAVAVRYLGEVNVR